MECCQNRVNVVFQFFSDCVLVVIIKLYFLFFDIKNRKVLMIFMQMNRKKYYFGVSDVYICIELVDYV